MFKKGVCFVCNNNRRGKNYNLYYAAYLDSKSLGSSTGFSYSQSSYNMLGQDSAFICFGCMLEKFKKEKLSRLITTIMFAVLSFFAVLILDKYRLPDFFIIGFLVLCLGALVHFFVQLKDISEIGIDLAQSTKIQKNQAKGTRIFTEAEYKRLKKI